MKRAPSDACLPNSRLLGTGAQSVVDHPIRHGRNVPFDRSGRKRVILGLVGIAAVMLLMGAAATSTAAAGEATGPKRPNVIFILSDDLGYGDLGCYGQTVIRTPRIDRMAREGIRFTQFYAGATVCAPSRCVLMTGLHTGHCHVRGNAGRRNRIAQSLRDEDVTVAEELKAAGYRTALIGKWGLGELEQPGHPLRQGFDYFFGYLNQTHAHNYYPEFLWKGRDRFPLHNQVTHPMRGGVPSVGGWATKRVEYSHDLFVEDALRWIRESAASDQPFFLYLALTIPHANNEATAATGNGAEVPDYGIYAREDWPDPDKGQAAMITRMDRDIGRLLDLLKELHIDRNTLVMFSSDNGPHLEANQDALRFNPAGPLRGMKRDLTDGGIRVPMIAWWPGTIQPGRTTDHVACFTDLMATARELAGRTDPLPDPRVADDSISFLPTLLGKSALQQTHSYLYWEFYERGSAQAVRMGHWKAVREPMLTGRVKLYDLSRDPAERYDVSRLHGKVAQQMRRLMQEAHVAHPNWHPPARRK